jgi:hypothetical protein
MKAPSRLWIWAAISVLIFFCVPYFFAGAYGPLLFGVPLWFLSVLIASLGLTGFTIYIVLVHWRLASVVLGEKEE